tara:strand:- start:64 stop:264 length:201 start_codon:yes stop_codon:yes gene_type:complete
MTNEKKQPASERLFDAFNDLVDNGISGVRIKKNKSKNIINWTIQILNVSGEVVAESESWNKRHFGS